MADIHQAVMIAGFHIHSGVSHPLRADAQGIFPAYISAQLAHLCILNSSSTAKHSSSCWPLVYSKLPVKPTATNSPYPLLGYSDKWLRLAWLPMPLGAAADCQHTLQGCCSTSLYCGCRDPGAIPWPCCCSLMHWPGNCSKGGVGASDNEKQGEQSFGEFKWTKSMATWLGTSQLQTFRHISRKLSNNTETVK